MKDAFSHFCFIVTILISNSTMAKPSINDMQSCQGMIAFLQQKVHSTNATYSDSDKNKVIKGLNVYDQYIQTEIITPELEQYAQASGQNTEQLQIQIDQYKTSLVADLQKKYPQKTLLMDYAVSLNECTKKAVPNGQALNDLKNAMRTLVSMAQQK